MSRQIRAIDLFCGAGGSSYGAKTAGVKIVAGFDLSKSAISAYSKNFPDAEIYKRRLENISVSKIAKKLGKIDLILASPECTNHSPAKGNRPRCEKSKETAFQVTRFAKVLRPRWIIIENVVSMKSWKRYSEFVERLGKLGYKITPQTLDASHFGVPQSRRRLFLLCDRRRQPPPVKKPKSILRKSAKHIIDKNGTYAFSKLWCTKRAKPTLARARRAIYHLGARKPFLLVYYGSDAAGGWQRLSSPLRTITTLDRFALVKPTPDGYKMRMLQVPELKAAMGMPKAFKTGEVSRRDQIRMLGNAVCPPVMRKIIDVLTKAK